MTSLYSLALEGGDQAVAAAMTTLEQELGALTPAGAKPDPFSELTRLRAANAALDAAVAKARERAARPVPPEAHVRHAIDDADRQAKWYQALKREWSDSRGQQRPFVNPVKPDVLRWRS